MEALGSWLACSSVAPVIAAHFRQVSHNIQEQYNMSLCGAVTKVFLSKQPNICHFMLQVHRSSISACLLANHCKFHAWFFFIIYFSLAPKLLGRINKWLQGDELSAARVRGDEIMFCCLLKETEGLRGSGRKSQIQSHLFSKGPHISAHSEAKVIGGFVCSRQDSPTHCFTSEAVGAQWRRRGGRGWVGL